jgi:hypothetical protein
MHSMHKMHNDHQTATMSKQLSKEDLRPQIGPNHVSKKASMHNASPPEPKLKLLKHSPRLTIVRKTLTNPSPASGDFASPQPTRNKQLPATSAAA